jgi:hypothetical protein
MKYFKILSFALLAFAVVSCDLEREVDIDLPEYEGRLFVECYLEPGQPMNLSLTRTSSYFDLFPTSTLDFINGILEEGATVTITHNGQDYELENNLTFNPFTQKVFNYSLNVTVPFDFENDFELNIITKDGETITGKTRITPLMPVDSVVTQFAENDTLARILVYMTDDMTQDNYFRRVLHEGSLDSIPEFSFALDDRASEGILIFGTFYDYVVGDTVINTIYSIEEDYFEFLQSIDFAVQSNGNPFAQPSPIVSNVEGTAGAIGIFTGFTYDRRTTIIER